MVHPTVKDDTSSMIGSEDQVHLILLTSIVMGACFGMIFGLMDVEDQRGLQLRDALIEDEEYCIPVGIILGGVVFITKFYWETL